MIQVANESRHTVDIYPYPILCGGPEYERAILGVALQMAGDSLEARDVMRQRIAIAREQGDLATMSSECGNLGTVERQLGNLGEAESLSREAMDIAARHGDQMMM